MRIKNLSVVRTQMAITDGENLIKAGSRGIVVHCYPSSPNAVMVEFSGGITIDVFEFMLEMVWEPRSDKKEIDDGRI